MWWHLINIDIWWDGYDEGYDQGYDAALLLAAHRVQQRRDQEQRLLKQADKEYSIASGFDEAYQYHDFGDL
jgi:hypothetical protein